MRSLVGKGVLVRTGRSLGDARRRARRWTSRRRCTGCCSPASTGCPPTPGACSRRRPCWGRCSTRRFCAAIATDAATCRGAARPPRRGRSDPAGRARPRRRRATGSRTRSCTRSSTRISCSRAAPSCTSGPGARSSALAGPQPERLSDLEALGHHWSLSSDKPQGRALSAGRRRLGARGLCQRRRDPPLRARASHPRRVPGLRRRDAGGARAPRRSAGRSPGGGPRRSRTTRRCGRSSRRPGIASGPRACTARSAGCTGKPATASAPAPASPSGLELLGDDGDPIERAHLFQEMGRLAFRAGDNAAAIAWAERALAEASRTRRSRHRARRARARPPPCARRPTTRSASRSRAPGRLAEAVDQIEQQRRAGRGARSAAGGLPRVHESRRALQLARPAPQHRDLPPRARDREEGGRSRLPVAALREPRGGLLRADGPVRGGRRRGGAQRPSTSIAGWGCSIIWRCR